MSIAERITSAMRLNIPVSEVQRLLDGEHALSGGEIADIACAIGMTASYLRGETDSVSDIRQQSGFGPEDVRFTRTPHDHAVITSRGFDTRTLMEKWKDCCQLTRG